jgi:2',3'-cyclic-nucleotide 2'-phosphodiesterase (5'-nucleotidase family)
MGNLVADALLLGNPGAEVALTNSGGLRADLRCMPPISGEQPCEITWGELFSVLPFGNTAVVETITGAQLEAALLNGVSPACNPFIPTGRFPQVAGLEVSYTCFGTVPQINSISLRPGGMGGPAIPLGPGDSVRLVTNDFMYFGGDGYVALMPGTDVVFTEMSLLELLGRYVTANSPVQAFVEGRIVKMGP